MKTIIFALLTSCLLFISCEQETLSVYKTDKSLQQIEAENISGTWIRPQEIKTPEGVRGDIISGDMRLLIRAGSAKDVSGVFYAYKVPMLFYPQSTTWKWVDNTTRNNIIIQGANNPIKQLKLELFDDNKKLKISFQANWKDTSDKTGQGQFEFVLNRQ